MNFGRIFSKIDTFNWFYMAVLVIEYIQLLFIFYKVKAN